MHYLIGIDDTDNLESRGTGYRARHLGESLLADGLAMVEAITRHQLLVDPRIPYTSHNSSACLVVSAKQSEFDSVIGYCREYLARESAAGSDAGLCVAGWPSVGEAVQEFGRLAKRQVLTDLAALDIAGQQSIYLEGLTGTGGGVIGALAAVGLRVSGNDGRFLWLQGLRELNGIYTAGQLCQTVDIDEIIGVDGQGVPPTARIDVGLWSRPILREGRAILLVEEADEHDQCEWRVARKELIKQASG